MPALSSSQLRLCIGLLQGLILFSLCQAADTNIWPASEPIIFGPLFLVALIVPVIVILNLGNMRPKMQWAWALIAAAALLMLAVYDIARRGLDTEWNYYFGGRAGENGFPSFVLIYFSIIGMFITQSLISAADADGNRIATYPRYFDVAWKLTVQLNFAAIFVGLFWLVVWSGAELFSLIRIDAIRKLIENRWFYLPATSLAFAYAIHITDVRASLVRGIRTVKLILLSWLLPIMTLFVGGFLIALPFQGLSLLWNTHHTSQFMLGTAVWLILLINAAYQDGMPEHIPPRVLRLSATIASMLLLPLIVIAVCALFVRTEQHGWTVNMIDLAACLLVAMCYAVGYLLAAIQPAVWLEKIEEINVYTSFVILAILIALFTPVADPARLSVDNQMNRLEHGQVSPEKFDYAYLRRHGSIYGIEALHRLLDTASPEVKPKIEAALKPGNQWAIPVPTQPRSEEIAANITTYPKGTLLPETFSKQDWYSFYEKDRFSIPQCLFSNEIKCDAILVPADKDSPQQLILMTANNGNATLFRYENNSWNMSGGLSFLINCKGVRDALHEGKFEMKPSPDQDLVVNGLRIRVTDREKCPKEE